MPKHFILLKWALRNGYWRYLPELELEFDELELDEHNIGLEAEYEHEVNIEFEEVELDEINNGLKAVLDLEELELFTNTTQLSGVRINFRLEAKNNKSLNLQLKKNIYFGWKLNVWKKNSLKTKCLKKDFEKEEGWKKTRRSNAITTKEAKPMKKVSRYFSYFLKYWHINENYCSISILPSQSKILEEPGGLNNRESYERQIINIWM